MKRENEYEKTGYKKETGSEEYQKNGKKQNEYCEQNIVDQILQMSEDTEVLNRLKPENIAKLLENKKQKKHDFLYWEFDETDQIGVRMGDWKMVVKKGTPFLYNLATDIHEDHDIAAGHPDIVKQMKEIIRTQHTPNPHFSVTLPSFE